MRRSTPFFLAGAVLLTALSSWSQVVTRAVPVAPIVPEVPSGAFLSSLALQAQSLTPVTAPLPEAFRAAVLPAPAAARPEAFA